jgi:hypothetical protein
LAVDGRGPRQKITTAGIQRSVFLSERDCRARSTEHLHSTDTCRQTEHERISAGYGSIATIDAASVCAIEADQFGQVAADA